MGNTKCPKKGNNPTVGYYEIEAHSWKAAKSDLSEYNPQALE